MILAPLPATRILSMSRFVSRKWPIWFCSKLQLDAFGSCCVVFDCHNYESPSAIYILYKDGTLSLHTTSIVNQDIEFINCGIDLLSRFSNGCLTRQIEFGEDDLDIWMTLLISSMTGCILGKLRPARRISLGFPAARNMAV
jgi:hypothetical protein